MPKGQSLANKENHCCKASKASTEKADNITNYSSFCASIFSLNCQGCEGYGLEHLSKQTFLNLYSSDPIFKNKLELMFQEEKKLLQTHKELIEKGSLERLKPIEEEYKEFQKGTTFKQKYTEKILNFLDRCKEFRTYLRGGDKEQ